MAFWRKNGSIVGVNVGDDLNPHWVPIRCDSCPCDGICVSRVKAKKKYLLDSGNYTLIAEQDGDYSCAEFEYDSNTNEWECTARASGLLVQVVTRYDTMPQNISYNVQYLIYGVTLRNSTTGEYITFGCQCTTNTSSYSCSHSFITLNNSCISGLVNLKLYDDYAHEQEYYISYACEPDECDANGTMLTALSSWYGGTLYNEGVIVDTSNENNSIPSFTLFKKLWVYNPVYDENENYTASYISVGCDCSIYGMMYGGATWDSQTKTAIEVGGICSSECPMAECMTAWLCGGGMNECSGEGVLVHKAYAYSSSAQGYVFGDWYDVSDRILCKACVETAYGFYYVPCDCGQNTTIQYISKDSSGNEGGYMFENQMDVTQTTDYWRYIEHDGTCECLDERELLMDNTEEFGIEEISFGSNTKYKYEYTEQEYGMEPSQRVVEGFGTCGQQSHEDYIEYRTFCYIGKCFDYEGNVRRYVKWINPEGSQVSNYSQSYQGYGNGIYDSIEFVGKAEPFSHDDDLNWDWKGNISQYIVACDHSVHCYQQREDAENECNNYGSMSSGDSCVGLGHDGGPIDNLNVSPPNYTRGVDGPDVYFSDEYSEWCCEHKHKVVGVARPADNGGVMYVIYRAQWIDTNLGILLNDGSGAFVNSFILYEFPGYFNADGDISELVTTRIVEASGVDESLHGCNDELDSVYATMMAEGDSNSNENI